ncbi:hypothetical protein Hanom_Chr14g01326511 [Helianthus anomalus]
MFDYFDTPSPKNSSYQNTRVCVSIGTKIPISSFISSFYLQIIFHSISTRWIVIYGFHQIHRMSSTARLERECTRDKQILHFKYNSIFIKNLYWRPTAYNI